MPLYIITHQFGLLGSYAGIILVLTSGAWGGALPFFLFRQFFGKIPHELIESAQVDGAREGQILLRIVLPMAKSIFGTVGLISFMINWGFWLPVLMLSNDVKTYTLSAALVNLNSELGVNFQQTMALATVVTVPIVVVFLLTQRRVMEGMAAGALKG